MIICPECNGVGFHKGSEDLTGTVHYECAWCHGTKEIDPDKWVDYQPHQQRPKQFCDIELRDGTIIEGCWPNADTFTQMVEPFKGQFKDYQVVKVKLSKRQPWDE